MGINFRGPRGKHAPVSMGAFPVSGATCRAGDLEASIKLSPKGVRLIDHKGQMPSAIMNAEFRIASAHKMLETAEFRPKMQYLSASAVDGSDV